MKQILPPELQPYDRKRYIQDLEYRLMVDLEDQGERHQRLLHLLNAHPYPNDCLQSHGTAQSS
jgi:hypothetical protein